MSGRMTANDRYERDRRALDLAFRMMRHAARLGTISRWTGLKERAIRRLRRNYEPDVEGDRSKRPRGCSPYRLEPLLRRPRLRKEVAALVPFLTGVGVLSLDAVAPISVGVDSGERLCDAFDAFVATRSEAILSIEQAILIVMALRNQGEAALAVCGHCHQAIVIEVMKLGEQRCYGCGGRVVARKVAGDTAHKFIRSPCITPSSGRRSRV